MADGRWPCLTPCSLSGSAPRTRSCAQLSQRTTASAARTGSLETRRRLPRSGCVLAPASPHRPLPSAVTAAPRSLLGDPVGRQAPCTAAGAAPARSGAVTGRAGCLLAVGRAWSKSSPDRCWPHRSPRRHGPPVNFYLSCPTAGCGPRASCGPLRFTHHGQAGASRQDTSPVDATDGGTGQRHRCRARHIARPGGAGTPVPRSHVAPKARADTCQPTWLDRAEGCADALRQAAPVRGRAPRLQTDRRLAATTLPLIRQCRSPRKQATLTATANLRAVNHPCAIQLASHGMGRSSARCCRVARKPRVGGFGDADPPGRPPLRRQRPAAVDGPALGTTSRDTWRSG